MKFKAAVLYKPGDRLSFTTVEMEDEPREDEVLVKIYASSICHSDEYVRSAGVAVNLPSILGHEGAGEVLKVGSKVTRVKPGDHVVMTVPHCGKCEFCKKGLYVLCPSQFPMQLSRTGGGVRMHDMEGNPVGQMMGQGSFAEYTMVHESSCVKVNDAIPYDIAAPVGCGFGTGSGTVLNYLKPTAEDSIAVHGIGATGIAAIMGAKLAGCKTIIAVGRNDEKLALAKELGATHVINSKRLEAEKGRAVEVTGPESFLTPVIYPLVEEIKAITGGKGVNYSVVTAPVPEVVPFAILSLAPFGECCVTASMPNIEIPIQWMQSTNTKVSSCGMGNCNKYEFFPYLLEEYAKGNYPIDRVLAHYKFEDINQAFEDMEHGKAVKPVMTW